MLRCKSLYPSTKETFGVFSLHYTKKGQNYIVLPHPTNQFYSGNSAVIPSAHHFIQTSTVHGKPNSGKASRSTCSRLCPSVRTTLPLLSLMGPLNTSKRVNSPASIWSRVSRTSC